MLIISTEYYFVRANGNTLHADPERPRNYVPGEPSHGPKGYFNHVPYCLREGKPLIDCLSFTQALSPACKHSADA